MAEQVTGNIYDRQLLKRMLSYLKPYRNKFIFALFITIILAILVPIRPYLFQYVLDIFQSRLLPSDHGVYGS